MSWVAGGGPSGIVNRSIERGTAETNDLLIPQPTPNTNQAFYIQPAPKDKHGHTHQNGGPATPESGNERKVRIYTHPQTKPLHEQTHQRLTHTTRRLSPYYPLSNTQTRCSPPGRTVSRGSRRPRTGRGRRRPGYVGGFVGGIGVFGVGFGNNRGTVMNDELP